MCDLTSYNEVYTLYVYDMLNWYTTIVDLYLVLLETGQNSLKFIDFKLYNIISLTYMTMNMNNWVWVSNRLHMLWSKSMQSNFVILFFILFYFLFFIFFLHSENKKMLNRQGKNCCSELFFPFTQWSAESSYFWGTWSCLFKILFSWNIENNVIFYPITCLRRRRIFPSGNSL